MECAVRRPVSAIRADACGESTHGSGKYQPGGHVSARSHNATAVPHPQGCPDQRAHCAGSGVPRALGLRTASDTSDDCRKESHAGTPVTHTTPTARPTRTVQKTPTPTMATATPQATPPSDWVPSAQTLQQLGWTGAGLSTGDALEAERTAWTFTDREMSLDYRNAGTRAQHGGTFTAAVFLLTPNARTRFFQNDVRAINNVLFDRVQQQQLIQEVVNAEPRLVQFQVQGQQQFAWVDVSFQLWQSQLDPQTGQRVEGLELDPATHAPRVHHMIVLLLRVTIGTQGANAPMGGTGWLVSTYALDPAGGSLPAIIQPA